MKEHDRRERWPDIIFTRSENNQGEWHNLKSLLLVMTGPPQSSNDPRDSSQYKYFKAISNKHGVRQDMESMCKFVRETLFYAMIHDARGSGSNPKDEIMGENGKASQIFTHVFLQDKDKISNVELLGRMHT